MFKQIVSFQDPIITLWSPKTNNLQILTPREIRLRYVFQWFSRTLYRAAVRVQRLRLTKGGPLEKQGLDFVCKL
jgi:hypothetical protein